MTFYKGIIINILNYCSVKNNKGVYIDNESNCLFVRVSTNNQDINNQKLEILNYANRSDLKIDKFIDVEASSRKDTETRRITELLSKANSGDVIITAELSRLGRSIVEVINIVNELVKRNIRLVVIKQSIDI